MLPAERHANETNTGVVQPMSKTPDTRHRRIRERGGRDFDTACAIIDAARVCHIGIALDGQPYVLPMACARRGKELLLHGSVASRLMKALADGAPCCATITHLDGLVLARSAFNSSMHYRTLMIFGQARVVDDPAEKSAGLDTLTDHLLPGRLVELRPSTRQELNATLLVALPIETFTTKVSDDPPDDAESDLDAEIWAGVVPIRTVFEKPETAPDMRFDIEPPGYLRDW
jgi:nitroimidazol reductase NimA-like FMN-containing flavoprotein (pyridoxamine 5'-phosphate oxidase superfamily)